MKGGLKWVFWGAILPVLKGEGLRLLTDLNAGAALLLLKGAHMIRLFCDTQVVTRVL